MNPQFIPEQGCPVEVLATRTDLEIDGFGAPIAARTYIDYRNGSSKPVAAVKFRIGYIDDAGKIRGMFHAPDSHPLEPGGQASQKWRGEKVDPRTSAIKIRVLIVKFVDGTLWESEKLKEVATPQGQGFAPLIPESGNMPASSLASPPASAAASGERPAGAPDTHLPGLDRGGSAAASPGGQAIGSEAVSSLTAEPPAASPASPSRSPKHRGEPPAIDPSLSPTEAFDALLQSGPCPPAAAGAKETPRAAAGAREIPSSGGAEATSSPLSVNSENANPKSVPASGGQQGFTAAQGAGARTGTGSAGPSSTQPAAAAPIVDPVAAFDALMGTGSSKTKGTAPPVFESSPPQPAASAADKKIEVEQKQALPPSPAAGSDPAASGSSEQSPAKNSPDQNPSGDEFSGN